MTKTTTQQYRKLLNDYATRVRGTAGSFQAQVQSATGGEAVGDLSSVPMHLADQGTDMFSQEISATLLEHEEHVLLEIDRALERLDQGTFGACENCGKPIQAGRLEAIPYARFCTTCTELLGAETRANLNVGRPGESKNSIDMLREQHLTGDTTSPYANPEQPPIGDETPKAAHADRHAAGTAGGGTAIGGLAGTNIGQGSPEVSDLEDATANGEFDREIDTSEEPTYSGQAEEAGGESPTPKRAKGGRTRKSR